MERSTKQKVQRFLIVCFLVATVNACSCSQRSSQQKFCSSNLAISGRVDYMQFNNISLHVEYRVNVTKIYRDISGSSTVKVLRNLNVNTPENDAVCGVTLLEGSEYFMSGFMSNGILSINSCGWQSLVSVLSEAEEQGINGGYEC